MIKVVRLKQFLLYIVRTYMCLRASIWAYTKISSGECVELDDIGEDKGFGRGKLLSC